MIYKDTFELIDISTAERASRLDDTAWANTMEWTEILSLASYMTCYKIKSGHLVFSEGDKDIFMGLVLRGSVKIFKEVNNKKQALTTVTKNKTLGEMALIDGQRRSASAVAIKDSVILFISQEEMDEMSQHDPVIWGKLLLKIGRLMSQRLRATSSALVDSIKR